ncbi:MAG: VWA domain-containing protein [Phycisphaerae bacterium]|nr:VWA domain-containing protein [Phycisphaerae bacterium]
MHMTASLLLSGFLATSAFALPGGEACIAAAKQSATPQTIELAICLDTSGSMNGLIDAARTKIWDIVSDLARATPQPKLRVALLTFGNDGHTAENGWTNIDIDFTDNLDMVSEKLFALTTNGGTELVGRVVDRATKGLSWSAGEGSLKILVVAGNESADQDEVVRYYDASKRAIEKMIVVNSIYCGSPSDQLAPAWQDVAKKADGHFAAIDQNNGTVVVETPFDADLTRLSSEINTTYIPFGSAGQWNADNQARQDNNAAGANSAAAAQRCVTKGGGLYFNSQWDLVDACKTPDFKLDEVKAEDLPENMRSMTAEARRAFIDEKAKARAEIQKRIQELGDQRATYIATEIAKRNGSDKSAFDRAIRDAIRAQASARGFAFPADPVVEAAPAKAPTEAPAKPAAAG